MAKYVLKFNIRLKCFKLIVPRDSAIIGLSGEKPSALDGNHLDIVKFQSKEDNNYIRVAGAISMLMKTIILPRQETSEGPVA